MHENPYGKSPAADGEPNRPASRSNLVVLWVSGIVLVGLFFAFQPSDQSPRHSRSRTQCANNLKYIGMALTNFESSHRRLPNSFFPNPDFPTEQFNWVIAILKQLDQELLADEIMEYGLEYCSSTRVSTLVCPFDAQEQNSSQLSYSINMGLRDTFFDMNRPYMTEQLDGTPFTSDSCLGAGGLLPMFKSTGERNQPVQISDFTDGASNTILAAENYDATYWNPYSEQLNRSRMEPNHGSKLPNPRRLPKSNQLFEFDIGLVWFERNNPMYPMSLLNKRYFGKWSNASNRHHPFRPKDFSSRNKSEVAFDSAYYYGRPAGGHGDGFNIARFDGSTDYISAKNLDYEFYCRMMTGNSRHLFKDRDNKLGYNSIGYGKLPDFD